MNLAAETHLKGGNETGVEAVPNAGVEEALPEEYLPTVPIQRFLSTFTPLFVTEINPSVLLQPNFPNEFSHFTSLWCYTVSFNALNNHLCFHRVC